MKAQLNPFAKAGAPVSFRQALSVAAGLLLAALIAMGGLTAVALSDADRLLDRLGRSQDQLARVTGIEADINAWLVSAYDGASLAEQRAATARIDAEIRAYLGTIAAERSVIADDPDALARQREETRQGEALADAVRQLEVSLGAPDDASSAPPDAERRRRLRTLAADIEARERAEAQDAIADMRALKNRTTVAGGVILALAALLCIAGVALMTARIGRPLRTLAAAAARVGRGETASTPLRPQGFTEIRHLAAAFNRLDEEVTAQRAALGRHAEDLEGQVAARTAELEASNAQLAEIDRTRRLFFSKVSHELRTPATVIRTEAEVALRRSDAPAGELREALEHVAANSGFLQRRLDDLLALARAEDGQIALRREPIRLGELLSDVVALAEPYTRSSGLRLIEEGTEGRDLVVVGDASWLQQALLALVDNAAKFAAASPEVRLSLEAKDGAATISVADGGPGVDADALPHLFDSFYQAPGGAGPPAGAGPGRTGRPAGAGVGLSVTRWVVEQHGGRVTARNAAGRGLLIELSLPVAS